MSADVVSLSSSNLSRVSPGPGEGNPARRTRVLHFGSGGGKGVTRVLVNLALGHVALGRCEALVVFRRKRGREVGEAFRRDLATVGVQYREVSPRPKFRTLAELRAIIREFRPDVLVAHGYSDHLWGRVAAFAEGVPVVVQAEHAHERYKWLHLWRSRRLAERTDAIVGVSRGVVDRLRRLGFPEEKLCMIHNGVRVDHFGPVAFVPWSDREPAVLMVSRFGRPKDPHTLIRAAAVLRDRGMPVRVRIVGGGKRLERWRARWLVRRLGLGELVEFLGPRTDLPELYRRHRVAVTSTHCEGFGLVVVEGMAAGCAVVASRVPGVEELIEHRRTGWLAEDRSPESFADGILAALGPEGAEWATHATRRAQAYFRVERMAGEYEALFDRLLAHRADANRAAARPGRGGALALANSAAAIAAGWDHLTSVLGGG